MYFKNRLIKRFNSSKLGTLELLLSNSRHQFDINGYVELKDPFEPNLFKTVCKFLVTQTYDSF